MHEYDEVERAAGLHYNDVPAGSRGFFYMATTLTSSSLRDVAWRHDWAESPNFIPVGQPNHFYGPA